MQTLNYERSVLIQKYVNVVIMGLCESQKAAILLVGLIIITVIGFVSHQQILTIFGLLGLIIDLVGLLSKMWNKDQIKKEKRLTKLNIDVFKLWMDTKKHESKFQIEISIDENIEKVLIKDAIDFLESKREKYGKILKLRTKIIGLKKDYNFIGENIRNVIIHNLADAYPSLLGNKLRPDAPRQGEYYFTNTIIEFVGSTLKLKILKNETINWDEIIPEPVPWYDVSPPIWSLGINRIDIQSNNKNIVNNKYYQTFMIDLISIIENDLKQQYEIDKKLDQYISDFKEKVHGLSLDIELNRV